MGYSTTPESLLLPAISKVMARCYLATGDIPNSSQILAMECPEFEGIKAGIFFELCKAPATTLLDFNDQPITSEQSLILKALRANQRLEKISLADVRKSVYGATQNDFNIAAQVFKKLHALSGLKCPEIELGAVSSEAKGAPNAFNPAFDDDHARTAGKHARRSLIASVA